jgi:hypothetical protein
MTYNIPEIHTVSITNDNAQPIDEEKTTKTPEKYFRAYNTPPLQSTYGYIRKETPDSLILVQI